MHRFLKSKTFLVLLLAAVLTGAYAVAGFLVAPKIIRNQAIQYVHNTYARDLQIGEVRVQPFRLQLEVRDVGLPDADGQPMLSLRRLLVNFELSSLWRRAYVFRDVVLEAPAVRMVVRPDGAVNLADLAPKQTAPAPAAQQSAPPRLWIQSLSVTSGTVGYVDLARRQRFAREFQPVTFELKDFRTTTSGGDFGLSARSGQNEQFDWTGRFGLAPTISSQGTFMLTGIRATGVAEFLGDALPFGLSNGLIDLTGSYRVSLGDQLDLKLQLPSVTTTGLALRARGVDTDWIQVPRLTLTGVAIALPEQTASVAALAVADAKAQAWMAADGTVNLMQLFAADTPDTAAAMAPPAVAPTRPWSLQIGSVDVTAAAIDFEDRMKAPVKRFAIAPLNLHVDNASLDLTRPLPVSMDATINNNALFRTSGTLTPAPLAANLDISVDKARMQILQPYVLPLADLTIRDGLLAMAGKLELRPDKPGPQLRFAGDITIDNFKSTDNALDEDFINFGRVQVQKLRYTMAPDSLDIDRILVRKPYARVVISQQQILNISAVLDPQGAAAAAKAADAKASAPKEPKAKAKAKTKAKAKAKAPPVQAPAPVTTETLPIRIREVRIEAGQMNFSDYSVRPNFSANVQDLKGTVTQLSSARNSRAKADLAGNLGEFSPVTISGELQPFAFDQYTDIGLAFGNISLPVFNPYSGEFAGYNIAKGKLTTDLHYLIQNRQLQASHKIRIDQLEWGEASTYKGEATLPVKFATSLLKDRNGVINLDIPVTGSLDDPKLRIGPIVWQIIRNLLVKAATAPFALLGSLFKGAEEAQFVDFAPGDAALDPQVTEQLAVLAKGLVEKPDLRLEIPAGMIDAVDRPALTERRFQGLLPAFETLQAKQKIDALTAVVKKQTGAVPKIPEPPAPPAGTTRTDAQALREAAAIDYLTGEARSHVTVTDSDLDALALARAEAVQHALLAGGELQPARVFVTRNGKLSSKDGKVRFELGLE